MAETQNFDVAAVISEPDSLTKKNNPFGEFFFGNPWKTGKSIQRDWSFVGVFIFDGMGDPESRAANGNDTGIDPKPVIMAHHITSITMPSYDFEQVTMMYGQVPRSFPVMDTKAKQFTIEMEEDELSTVDKFINWNQRLIISANGYYTAPNKVKIPFFIVEVTRSDATVSVVYKFRKIFFISASAPTYTYAGGAAIKRTITFGYDFMSVLYADDVGFMGDETLNEYASTKVDAKNSTDVDYKVGSMLI